MSISLIQQEQIATDNEKPLNTHLTDIPPNMFAHDNNALLQLHECAQDISATLDLATVLTRLATHARELFHATYSIVYLLDPQTQKLHLRATQGHSPQALQSTTIQLGEGLVGRVAQQGSGEIVLPTEPALPAWPSPSTQSRICAPLIYAQHVIGVITLARRENEAPFTQTDLDLCMRLVGLTAAAIAHAQLYHTERERSAELSHALTQQQELKQTQKQFIQDILHELRTPLTVARGYAELLEFEGENYHPAECQSTINIIARRLRMLSKLLQDLNNLLHVHTQEADFASVDFAATVQDSARDFDLTAAKAGLTINIAVADHCAPVWGHCTQLRRVLDNLVGNALKFTPAGGRIDVAVKQEDNHLILTVSDTGIGIPKDQLTHIFKRFYQIKNNLNPPHNGVGLGLSMVESIVKTHGGHIEVHSTVGQGSTFIVSLPTLQD